MDIEYVRNLLGSPDCDIQSQNIRASGEFSLQVYTFTPKKKSSKSPVIFVAGWASVMDGWAPLLSKWVECRTIHYVETREKRSAQVSKSLRPRDFSMVCHTNDLECIAKHIGKEEEILWFGSSLGATAILEGFLDEKIAGKGAFLIAPNAKFKFPTWMVPLTMAPWWCYAPLIRVGLIYLKWRLNEPAQYVRYKRTLTQAHLLRLKRSLQANRKYKLTMDLDKISFPVAICAAESDTLHEDGAAHRIANNLGNGVIVNVPSNQYAHEADLIKDIDNWEKLHCD
ncbi:MAG: alpha/beta hydrolase [Candidatus Thalassarchaeaceae archaeon]|jgi:pimeloyl-ACP methyl ester carboxylesterase|nr:alpha/beta hydrolase [Candidatus Thalassarchaeaceae archaeon]